MASSDGETPHLGSPEAPGVEWPWEREDPRKAPVEEYLDVTPLPTLPEPWTPDEPTPHHRRRPWGRRTAEVPVAVSAGTGSGPDGPDPAGDLLSAHLASDHLGTRPAPVPYPDEFDAWDAGPSVPPGPYGPDRGAPAGHAMAGHGTASRWSWAHQDADSAAELWDELVDFVCWLDDRYLRHQPGTALRLKACWYRHPVAVEELTALLAAWQAAYCPPGEPEDDQADNSPTDALTRWHQYALWPALQRLQSFAGWTDCGPPDGHRERDDRYDPDLRAGLDVFLAEDLTRRPKPTPRPDSARPEVTADAPPDLEARDEGAAPLLLQNDITYLLRQGMAVELLPGDPATPLHIDGGWWACPPAPDGAAPTWAPVLDDDVASALTEHYQLVHGHPVEAAPRPANVAGPDVTTDNGEAR